VKIIDVYIGKQVILMILLVTVALFGLDLFFNLVNELRFAGKGDYTISRVFVYLLLSAPSKIYTLFPWAALIGSIISLGNLANHSELVILRAAGVSVWRIACSVLKAACLLTFFVVLVGEGLAPMADALAQKKRTLALSRGQSIQTQYGLWVKQENDFIHVQSIRADGELLGITRYQFNDERKLEEVSFSASGIQQGKKWLLRDVKGTRFTGQGTAEAKTEVFSYPELEVVQLLDPDILKTASIKHLERLSLPVLWRTISHGAQQDLHIIPYQLAFWTKIMEPVVILVMVFLAVPFVFGPLRSINMGFRIVCGITMAFIFHTLNGLFAPLAVVYQFPPLLAVLAPIVLFMIIGAVMMKRTS
jgi:lipopolysaccharide export system permease protein